MATETESAISYPEQRAELHARISAITAELRPLGDRPSELRAPRINGQRDMSAIESWDATVREFVRRYFDGMADRARDNEMIHWYLNRIFVSPPDVHGMRPESADEAPTLRVVTHGEVAAWIAAAPAAGLYRMFVQDED